jgi:outer membrane protein assembly factor BamB
MTMRYSAVSLACVVAVSVLSPAKLLAGDWLRFRGPDGSGIAAAGELPTELDVEKNLLWKVSSGTGTSSPVIASGRLFLTAFEGESRLLKCFDANSGELLWTKSVRAARKEVTTPPGGPANPTPVADEANVYVFFPDFGIVSYTHGGDERWQVPLGPFHSFHGLTASLVLADGHLILLADQLQDSFISAFNCLSGAEAWKVPRQDGPIGGYSSPATRVTAKGTELIVSGPLEVVGYDAASGKRNWSIGGVANAPVSVPVVAGNRVYVCEPSFTENPFKIDSLLRHDKNQDGELSFEELEGQVQLYRIARLIDKAWGNNDGKISGEEMEQAFKSFIGGGGLVAIELDEKQQPVGTRVSWTYRKSVPQIPSLLLIDRALFFINDGGILTSMQPDSGEIIKRARLGHGAKFYASPVAATGRLLLIDTEGKISIVSAEAEWKVLSTSLLGQGCYATPAITGDRIYVRGESDLFCFGHAG